MSHRHRTLFIALGATAAGIAILVGAVLPAEYGVDPLGIGRATGIGAIFAPEERVAAPAAGNARPQRSYATAWRSDIVDIPVDSFESGNPSELEYKVRMRRGATLLYSWEVPGVAKPDEFYTEFHGHTVAKGEPQGRAMTVAYYRKANGVVDKGALVAPFDGVHGWFFQNSAAKLVHVRLRLSGFYELVPPGEPGNEAGLIARPVREPI